MCKHKSRRSGKLKLWMNEWMNEWPQQFQYFNYILFESFLFPQMKYVSTILPLPPMWIYSRFQYTSNSSGGFCIRAAILDILDMCFYKELNIITYWGKNDIYHNIYMYILWYCTSVLQCDILFCLIKEGP